MKRLRAAEYGRERLEGDAHDVVVRLLCGQGAPGGLRVESELLRPWIGRAEPIAHGARPQPARRTEFRDLLEKVVVGVEEERKPLAELIHVESGVDRRLHVGGRVRQREGDLLHGRRPGLPNVIATDRDGVPVGDLTLTEREDVRDDAEGGAGRIDVGAAGDVFLEDVVLNRSGQLRGWNVLTPRDGDVEGQQNGRRRVDGHRGGDAIERDAVKQGGHVLDGIDGHADFADLALCHRVIGVVAHLGRQIEGDAQAVDPLSQQVTEALIRLGGRAKPGVLAHRPQPAAVHRRLDAARERKFAGETELAHGLLIEVSGRVWRYGPGPHCSARRTKPSP